MYNKILSQILNRKLGETTITAGSDGAILLKVVPMAALLVYMSHIGESLAAIQVVRGGFVMFSEEDYEKWVAECKAAREGKVTKQARPRQWRRTVGGWQSK